MSSFRLTEEQLILVNSTIQKSDNVLVHNCLTRTAQESKLFPILPYLDMVMIDSYYRWPDLLRKVAAVMSPEDLGHRVREVSTNFSRIHSWSSLAYYLNGRAMLIRNGLLRPEDNLEDLWFMVDFHQRVTRTYNRASGNHWMLDAGDIAQIHEERQLQVFEADAFEADAALKTASQRFAAAATQYNFLIHCESRSGLASSGPYQLGGQRLMHVRDFLNMTECGLSWMDGVGTDLPFANLSMVLITDGVGIEITDWGTAYTTPEAYQDKVIGVGLYTSDVLTDRYVPVGMGSRKELVDTFDELTLAVNRATRELYSKFASMDNQQMVEAGIATYLRAPVDLTMIAGVYDHTEWDYVDDRTRRLWEIYNEEYSYDAYVDKFATLSGLRGGQSEYYLHPITYGVWRRGGRVGDLPAPGRSGEFVPGDVLRDHDYSLRVNPGGLSDSTGSWSLPPKTGALTVSSGRLTEDELNAAARAFSSPLHTAPWRHLDEASVKWRHDDPEVDAMYRYAQERSRLLAGRGSSLVRADLDEIRREAGERPWSEVSAAGPVTPMGVVS
ncbi:hypothetical protein [Paraconexibacter algicola]|uniref:Uncharacterized protein n=1 Tax=Paraconexibacter algicola TaxID=2133960 RepID=A0A2T4ULA1_9ACTN|nr:hypothetical protein [Paraconexibacter algicola]PTL60026.1 hypothetical protein C7Y72_10400 [Paraconexibacter algicola]